MQNDYRTSILSYIERYKSLAPVEIIRERFPEQPDLSAVPLGQYTAATFLSLGNYAIESLEVAMNAAHWHTLPSSLQGHNEFSHVDINGSLSAYVDHITQKNLELATQDLSRLIWYCMANGIWLDEKKVKAPTRTDVKLLADELTASAKRITGQLEAIDKASTELVERRQDLVRFTEEKKSELGDIRRGLEDAKQHVNSILSLLELATAKSNEINTIKDNAQNVLNELNVQLGVIQKELDAFRSSATDLKDQLGADARASKETLDQAKALYEFVKSKEAEIIRLTGMAADGSLGTKFNARSVEIGSVLWWWRWAVPVSLFLSIGWVIAVFLCFSSTMFDVAWANLLVNLLKTAPAFVLVGFVMAQYSKERNLREDYAFKAAVSMTINAYADILQGGDDVKNVSRQKLILSALKQVHNPPKLHREKGGSLFSWRAKDLQDSLKNINETLKEAKDTLKT